MRALVVVLLLCGVAAADPAATLRDANAAAASSDWARVRELVAPLVSAQLAKPDRAEAYRLAGLAAFFENDLARAEAFLFEYMKLDLDGQLDPSVYPPEAIGFFANVRQRHFAELRALRPKPKGSIWLALLPPVGQFQNGDRTKGIILGSALGVFAATQIATYVVLGKWCTRVTGSNGSSATCDDGSNHYRDAKTLTNVNWIAGAALIATYIYGVYDGVSTYRRRTREMQVVPFATTSSVGVSLTW